MPRTTCPALLLLATIVALSSSILAQGQPQTFALESIAGLRLHNVKAEPATLLGKKGIQVTRATATEEPVETLAAIDGLEFGNGVIQAEIAGAPGAGAGPGARGFVGVAFRLQTDMRTYDAFYLRPTNGRADDQIRRNHPPSTSRIRTGHGLACARRRQKSTNRMSTSFPASGRRSRSKCSAHRPGSSCTTSRSRHSSSAT